MALTEDQIAKIQSGEYEVRCYFEGHLTCPNPREYYRMTRTYQQMKAEYDLLHADEVSEEDIYRVALEMRRSQFRSLPSPYYAYYIMLAIEWAFLLYFAWIFFR